MSSVKVLGIEFEIGKNQDIENMKRVCPKSLIDNMVKGYEAV